MNQIVITLVVAFIIWAVRSLFLSRALYLISPKLYLSTSISDGQIITLELYNAGLSSEEDVAVTLRSGCRFELIGTSKSTLAMNGSLITVPKLSRFEKVTVLLLVEGRAFSESDIEGIESRATKGKVIPNKESATTPWASVIILPIILLVLLMPFCVGTVVGADMKMSAWSYLDNELHLFGHTKELAGFKTNLSENYSQGKMKGLLKKQINVQLSKVVRYGDTLSLSYILKNDTSFPLFVKGSIDGSAGDTGVGFYDRYLESSALAPNESKIVKLQINMPENLKVKIAKATFGFDNLDNETLSVVHMAEFN